MAELLLPFLWHALRQCEIYLRSNNYSYDDTYFLCALIWHSWVKRSQNTTRLAWTDIFLALVTEPVTWVSGTDWAFCEGLLISKASMADTAAPSALQDGFASLTSSTSSRYARIVRKACRHQQVLWGKPLSSSTSIVRKAYHCLSSLTQSWKSCLPCSHLKLFLQRWKYIFLMRSSFSFDISFEWFARRLGLNRSHIFSLIDQRDDRISILRTPYDGPTDITQIVEASVWELFT